jgi:hypothetical protein
MAEDFRGHPLLNPRGYALRQSFLLAAHVAIVVVALLRLAGHSHISETYAVGTGDEFLSGPVLDFIHGAGGGEKVGSR